MVITLVIRLDASELVHMQTAFRCFLKEVYGLQQWAAYKTYVIVIFIQLWSDSCITIADFKRNV
jgi:hypothetical protein